MSRVRPAFLLSLPRAGSTLLQRLLATHSQVATVAEPWLLLPPLYALRPEGVYSEYGHRVMVRAVTGVVDRLPRGRADYLDAVAGFAQDLYDRLSPPGTTLFLDKTPRYGLIVEELAEAFPDSPIIVLHRNPLAVIASLVSTFTKGRWELHHHKQDLYLLPERLLAAQARAAERFLVLRYEDLVQDTAGTLMSLVEALGLAWEPRVVEDFTATSVKGGVGDPTGTSAYDGVSVEPLDKWRTVLRSPVRKAWARRYLKWLGAERVELMGYDLHRLLAELEDVPTDRATSIVDLVDSAKGLVWSALEVDIARAKLRSLPRWHRLFSHS